MGFYCAFLTAQHYGLDPRMTIAIIKIKNID